MSPTPGIPERFRKDDEATIQAIRGKGIGFTVSSHFAIAVITAIGAAIYGHETKSPETSDSVALQARACNEKLDRLEQSITALRGEMTLNNQQTNTQISLLVVRTDRLLSKP